MTYDSERDDAPSYEGEVTEESTRLRPRTWAALIALGAEGISLLMGNYLISVGLIVCYVAWMFLRDALRRRRRNRDWNTVANNVMEGDEIR
jgi:hypothetical protein